jgi:hypothetical protein
VPGEEVEPMGVEDHILGDEERQNHKKTWKKLESIQG